MLVGWDTSVKRFYCHILPAKGTDFPGLEAVLKLLVEEMRDQAVI